MNQDRDSDFMPQTTPVRKVMSFKAAIVMTIDGGREPTLEDVKIALVKAGVRCSVPATADAPIVLSFKTEEQAGGS